MRATALPLLAAAALIGLWLTLPSAAGQATTMTTPMSVRLTPDTVVAALAAEERQLRRTVDERVRRGARPPTGPDPAFLAVGRGGEPVVVTRAGDVFAVVDSLNGVAP